MKSSLRAFCSKMERSRRSAQAKASQVEDLRKRFFEAQTALQRFVSEHNTARLTAINTQLAYEGNSWCTRCNQVVPLDKLKLILHQYERERSGGYQGGDIVTDHYSNLYRACPQCRNTCSTSSAKNSRVYDAQEHDGVLYVSRRHGRPEPLSGFGKPHLAGMPEELLSQLATWWNVPPAIEVKNGEIVDIVPPPQQKSGAA